MLEPFRHDLQDANLHNIKSLIIVAGNIDNIFQLVCIYKYFLHFTFVLAFLVSQNIYDSHARCLLRNMKTFLAISDQDFIAMECRLSLLLNKPRLDEAISHSFEEPKSDNWRYAKIGAASLGAGALLAVTGGIAAPVLLAAIGVYGGVAAVTTVR